RRVPPYSHSFPTRRPSDLSVRHLPGVGPPATDGKYKRSLRLTSFDLPIHGETGLADSALSAAAATSANTIATSFRASSRSCSIGDRKSTRLNSSHGSISYA